MRSDVIAGTSGPAAKKLLLPLSCLFVCMWRGALPSVSGSRLRTSVLGHTLSPPPTPTPRHSQCRQPCCHRHLFSPTVRLHRLLPCYRRIRPADIALLLSSPSLYNLRSTCTAPLLPHPRSFPAAVTAVCAALPQSLANLGHRPVGGGPWRREDQAHWYDGLFSCREAAVRGAPTASLLASPSPTRGASVLFSRTETKATRRSPTSSYDACRKSRGKHCGRNLGLPQAAMIPRA